MTRAEFDDDPRLPGDRTRRVEGLEGALTLVGVVHEHPASVHRVRTVVSRASPDVLALELPPLAVTLFEDYAADEDGPPAHGGEMSAAIQAATTDRVVGIDGPSVAFLVRLGRALAGDRPDREAIRGVLDGLIAASKESLVCGVAGTIASRTGIDIAVGRPVDHECSRHDGPTQQADDEQRQIRRARAVMDAVEPSRGAAFRDEIREAHMAERLETLQRDGDVVAVVGYGHLDAIVDRLTNETAG